MKNYYIKDGYRINEVNRTLNQVSGQEFWNHDFIELSDFAQYYVYREAYRFAREQGIHAVLDIGCGVGTLLKKFFERDFKIYGVDQESTVNHCRSVMDGGIFVADNIESPKYGLKSFITTVPLIICADVIEHLLDPDKLIDYIKNFSDKYTWIIISTPERDALSGSRNNIPKNPYHVREWNSKEFKQYINSAGLKIYKHKIVCSNRLVFNFNTFKWVTGKWLCGLPFKHTQLVFCKIV